ncbi:hypothetical protein TOT_030000394 [Theileria orientalis strain Shintoku]|uniref:Uncharacterized protein n=1 Tax=Theileria orientalis strain Shintoku TaxID=869250 RepID=J4C3W2_THEOR|nr:hypothetical protein TOT_030000394 [Theileria orientalis strain Shintoku]PVC54345.1 hypothetical protein MACL_00003138 [Theileria orientalis]BAM41131.1 hypothetical protein TOT_030000394 [Theileria orientalis strain Shintoku]|eukprot:XP_009691432.1 hypothetical protein TOT_030000394 [Theileria orientalis strain Shintoku]
MFASEMCSGTRPLGVTRPARRTLHFFRNLGKGIQRNIGEKLHICGRRIKITTVFEFIGYFELLLEIRENRNLL